MKKIFYILFVLLMAAFLTACSGNDTADNTDESDESTEQKQEETKKSEKSIETKKEDIEEKKEDTEKKKEDTEKKGISVEKNLADVKVTLPAFLFEGKNVDEVIAGAKEEGVKKAIKNEDGSITYIISKADHKKMMSEMGASITEYTENLKNSEEFSAIKDVTHNKSFSEFILTVERTSFENSLQALAVLGLGLQGSLYQLFDGAAPDEYKVTIKIKDEATGDVFKEIIYPDAAKEAKE